MATKKKPKLIELKISPSRAYLATQCLEWQNIKSGERLLKTSKGNQNLGIEKHSEIENDISIVKNFLPKNWEKMELYQEKEVETEIEKNGFLLKIRGFVDAYLIDWLPNKLYVFDWKTGGSQVDSLADDQLILYALAILDQEDEFDYETTVEIIYVNPDLNTSFTKVFTVKEIIEKAYKILDEIVNRYKGKSYNVGDHCNYCPAKSACPELLKNMKLLISPEVNGKPIENFSEMQLDLIRIGEKIIEELKTRLKNYLALNPDKTLHGYTLANRAGKREISNLVDLKEFADKLGITDLDDLFEKKLLSVKELENRGYDLELVQDHIYQPQTKVLKKINI